MVMVGVETHVWLTQPREAALASLAEAGAAEQRANELIETLAERHPELASHLERAAQLSAQVALWLGLDGSELWRVGYAARLHDIGKIAIPARVLDKPGRLNNSEWRSIKRHTVIGAQILEGIPALAPVAPLVRASHERWDGAGYPDGIAGEEIPLASRVVFACDAWDAMTSKRPYQSPLAPARALGELRRCSGTQFDPMVVDALSQVLSTGEMPARA